MGTMAKALHSGNAARAGVEAAMLARRGFTADAEIIEAPLGFLHAVCLPEDRDVAAITERLGRPFVLAAPLPLKRFPACNPAHPLIEAALVLAREHQVRTDDIVSIAADLHTFSLLRTDPEDEESAGFSAAFLIAATLVHGAFGLDQLSEQVVHDPRVRDLMQRVRHVPAAAPETITVSLRDGKAVSTEVLSVQRLTGREAVREKFRQCAGPVLGRSACETVESAILKLDEQPDLVRLMVAAGGSDQQHPPRQIA
jgi:2-methylcitrate dehydratase PrpD